MNVIADYDQFFRCIIVTQIQIGRIFHKTLLDFDTNMAFFKETYEEKINFVRDLSLSQRHTLRRSGNRCIPPCFATQTSYR